MSDFPWGGLIGGVVGGAVSLFNNQQNIKYQQEANKMNIDFQRETNKENEALMRESWARDDSAVQRRTQDLVKAGLNPILAAGSAAGNSGPIQVRAPQVEAPQRKENEVLQGLIAANAAQDLEQKKASIAQTAAQTRMVEAQALKTQTETNILNVDYRYQADTLAARTGAAISKASEQFANTAQAQLMYDINFSTSEATKRIKLAEASIADNEKLVEMQKVIQSVIDSKIKGETLTKEQGLAMQAVAVGQLAKMQADFYEGMGMSKDLVMVLSSILGDALKGALLLAR